MTMATTPFLIGMHKKMSLMRKKKGGHWEVPISSVCFFSGLSVLCPKWMTDRLMMSSDATAQHTKQPTSGMGLRPKVVSLRAVTIVSGQLCDLGERRTPHTKSYSKKLFVSKVWNNFGLFCSTNGFWVKKTRKVKKLVVRPTIVTALTDVCSSTEATGWCLNDAAE